MGLASGSERITNGSDITIWVGVGMNGTGVGIGVGLLS